MSGSLSSHSSQLRAPTNAVQLLQPRVLRVQPLNDHSVAGSSGRRASAARATGGTPAAAGAPGGRRLRQLRLQARRPDRQEFDEEYAAFDDEEDWEQKSTPIQAGMGLTPILQTALRGVGAIADKLTDFALQFAPEDTSPGVVKVAVNAGLLLLALSFVKSLLSFFLTLGTIILGAYVAVRVFGIDVPGVGGGPPSSGGGSLGSGGQGGNSWPKQQQKKRKLDPRSRQSEFKGLLGASDKISGNWGEDGLLDVWFERKAGSSDGGGGGKARDKGRQ